MDGSGTVTKVIFIAFQTHMCVHNTQKKKNLKTHNLASLKAWHITMNIIALK